MMRKKKRKTKLSELRSEEWKCSYIELFEVDIVYNCTLNGIGKRLFETQIHTVNERHVYSRFFVDTKRTKLNESCFKIIATLKKTNNNKTKNSESAH
jgi:hypothetical protein